MNPCDHMMDNENIQQKVTNEDKKESNRVEEFKLPLETVSIGVVESIFNKKNGSPRQSGICPQSKGIIRIHKRLFNNPTHPIEGIEQFQYLWIIFYFHENKSKRRFIAKVHPPRLDGLSCGVFASRSPHRPNPFGLTIVKLDSVKDGCLHVSGLDMIDQTPVIDIKPFIEKYDYPYFSIPNEIKRMNIENCENDNEIKMKNKTSNWIDGSIVSEIQVDFTARSLNQLSLFHWKSFHQKIKDGGQQDCCDYCLRLLQNDVEAKEAIVNLLKADPRSVYRRKKCVDRLYFFTIDSIHITAWFDIEANLVEVLKIKPNKKQSTDQCD